MFDTINEFSEWLSCELGRVRNDLGMETAIASYIDHNEYTIVDVDSEMEGIFSIGQKFPLQDTYCRAVVEQQEHVNYDHVATIKTMLQHPVYQAVKLESYIASPIKNREEQVVGTLNFTSLYPHAAKFDLTEKELVEQFSRKVSENIEFYKILSLRASNA